VNWRLCWTWILPTWYTKPMTEIMLKRLFDNQWCTIGSLSLPGFMCSTIELPKSSSNGSAIRIPAGRYSMRLFMSPRWGKEVPLLVGVPGRSLIEIHPSNYAIRPSDGRCLLEGCIAPGTNPSSVSVDDSTHTWNDLMKHIDWTGEVWITIQD
jgi:hypothetical protein